MNNLEELKKEIFKEVLINSSNELANKYFKECGLKIQDITIEQLEMLKNFINKEVYTLLIDGIYKIIKELCMNREIRKNKKLGYIKLLVDGSYFVKREAISFYYDGSIGFCNWANGCNRIPFIKGFIFWCDWIKNNLNKGKCNG